MRKVDKAADFNGRAMGKGDTVSVLSDHMTARICDIALDDGELFVRLKPLHQPYGRGIWLAAEQVLWLAAGRKNKPRPRQTASKSDRHG